MISALRQLASVGFKAPFRLNSKGRQRKAITDFSRNYTLKAPAYNYANIGQNKPAS